MHIRRQFKRGFAVLLALAILLGMIPLQTVEVNALTPTYTVSSAYKNSEYYDALCAVELTGNQREDIINVALSQVGYCEGNYSGDTSGSNDGVYNNYTETNYWYNNYVTSDMPIGGTYAPWCATFVSWCAEQARIPTSILRRSTAAGVSSWCFDLNFYAGGSTLYSSSDNSSKFLGYNYTPKKGDLFFTRTWSHVGLVVGVSGSYVLTVEGNTNSGGSAEGEGVFRRSRLISDLYFGVPEYVEDYTSSCTYYPSHCQIKVDTSTPINTQPCSESTANDSVNLGYASAGQTYTATGLYKNTYGNYWYRIESGYSKTGYIYAGDTTYVKQITTDLKLVDAEAPSAHISGTTYTVNGTVKSQYNRIEKASCYIYSGFGSSGSAVTGYNASVGSTQYALDGSDVDYNTSFGSLSSGKYTYEIAATYINYYATGSSSISSNTGTVKLMTEYFMVIPSSVSQSSCAHSYTTTMVGAATCLEGGTQVKACSTCGLVTKTEIASGSHTYGSWTTVSAATCTTDGKKTRSCSVCGYVDTQTLQAVGHSYTTRTTAATCTQYAIYEFTCGICGDYYKRTANELATGWIEFLPGGMDASLFRTQTQYRYSDYETKTSTATSLAGYTQTGSSWIQSGTGTVQYVPSWPSGFSTSSSLYSTYNKAGSKKTASETATARTVINSDEVGGYLYYHWCYAGSYYSTSSSSGSYTTFHAYYDTTDPDTYTCDTSDMSYKTSHSTCSNSEWWFVTPVYAQKYTTYQKQFTYERWTDFSAWSASAVTASSTRKVETRTVYQLINAPTLAGHNYVNGKCTVCGVTTGCSHTYNSQITTAATCTAAGVKTYTCVKCGTKYTESIPATGHTYVNGKCSSCGAADPNAATKSYYLFGYINGGDYACEGDYANLGVYKFTNGKLTTTFESDSYVGVKTGDNGSWYMTNGWLGMDVTSAVLYDTNTLTSADKLYVPGGVQVTFTLKENADGTLSLSYTTAGTAPSTKPTIGLKYPTVSFEDEIVMNVYYTASDLQDVAEMGLITYSYKATNYGVGTAEHVVPGYGVNAADGYYYSSTAGIAPKDLSDTIYFAVYAKLTDGTYTYTSLIGYSPKTYASSQLKSGSADMKALVVAMLNYGAAAQTYFGYKTNALMNADLTAAQKALVSSYSSSMIATVTQPSGSKLGEFVNDSSYTKRYPTISFEGAFCVNYYFQPSKTVKGDVMMYLWSLEDYNKTSVLTRSNATKAVKMTLTSTGEYLGVVDGIAAKDLDKAAYVTFVYSDGTTNHCGGVIGYTIGLYCKSQASKTGTLAELSKACAVYGYYAKNMFYDQV